MKNRKSRKNVREYLTAGEAARFLNMAPRSFSKICDHGDIPSVRLPMPGAFQGWHRRVHRDDLIHWCILNGYRREAIKLKRESKPWVLIYVSDACWAKALLAQTGEGVFVQIVDTPFLLGWFSCHLDAWVLVLDVALYGACEASYQLTGKAPGKLRSQSPLLIGLVPEDRGPTAEEIDCFDCLSPSSVNPAVVADTILQYLAGEEVGHNHSQGGGLGGSNSV